MGNLGEWLAAEYSSGCKIAGSLCILQFEAGSSIQSMELLSEMAQEGHGTGRSAIDSEQGARYTFL